MPPARNFVIALIDPNSSNSRSRLPNRTHDSPFVGLSLRGCTSPEPLVCCGSAVGQGHFIPVSELALEVPQLHRPAFAPALGNGDRAFVIGRFELAAMLDVAAETVHEIQAVVQHRRNPPVAEVPYITERLRRRISARLLEPREMAEEGVDVDRKSVV